MRVGKLTVYRAVKDDRVTRSLANALLMNLRITQIARIGVIPTVKGARCGMYYLKKTRRQKVYCSRRCGTLATSISSNRKTRMGVQRGLAQRAQDKMGEWEKQVPDEKWKNGYLERLM